jgi:hypothetical protein
VPAAIVGVTIVSIGTTLPEMITGVMAVRNRQTDVAIGNAIGSCLFHAGAVFGIVGLVAPPSVDGTLTLPIVYMGLLAIALVPISRTFGKRVSRLEGGLLLASYAGFLVLSAISATRGGQDPAHPMADHYQHRFRPRHAEGTAADEAGAGLCLSTDNGRPHPRRTLHRRLNTRKSTQVISCHRPAVGPHQAIRARVARTRGICWAKVEVGQRKAAGVIARGGVTSAAVKAGDRDRTGDIQLGKLTFYR